LPRSCCGWPSSWGFCCGPHGGICIS